MSVNLLRSYSGWPAGANVVFDAVTEAALVAQGLATYDSTVSGVLANPVPPAVGAITGGTYGPAVVYNIPMGAAALTGFETNGVVQTAFQINLTEIFVPHWNTWTGAGVLNGTTVGTNTLVYWLFNTAGYLIEYTAIAGTTTSGASTFQKIAFNNPVTLSPGRYFVGVQANGNTDTIRHVLSANGAEPRCGTVTATASFAASLTALSAATAATPSITVPTSFTTAVAPIVMLYS